MDSVQPVLTVRSVYRAVDWYCAVLGFEVAYLNEHPGVEGSLNYAVLRNGPVGLHLGLERDMEVVAGQGGCNFVTHQFEAAYESARKANATFYLELAEIPSGARTFGIKDPDGNLIAFVEES